MQGGLRPQRQLQLVLLGGAIAAALAAAVAAWLAFGGDDGPSSVLGEEVAPTATLAPEDTATPAEEPAPADTPSDVEAPSTEVEEAAARFVDAWSRDDRDAALAAGTPDAVDRLFAVNPGDQAPQLEECFNVGTDQSDCNVSTTEGLLVVRVALIDGTYLVEDFVFP